jgi:hypothetical protein
VFIEPNPANVGAERITFAVTGLHALLEHLTAEHIDHGPIETYSNGVRHVKIPTRTETRLHSPSCPTS